MRHWTQACKCEIYKIWATPIYLYNRIMNHCLSPILQLLSSCLPSIYLTSQFQYTYILVSELLFHSPVENNFTIQTAVLMSSYFCFAFSLTISIHFQRYIGQDIPPPPHQTSFNEITSYICSIFRLFIALCLLSWNIDHLFFLFIYIKVYSLYYKFICFFNKCIVSCFTIQYHTEQFH